MGRCLAGTTPIFFEFTMIVKQHLVPHAISPMEVSTVDSSLIMAEIYTGIGGNCSQIMPEERVYTAKIMCRKLEKDIPSKETARPQSQFQIHISESDL